MANYWIGVASKNHVRIGVQGGFCQLCHGKEAPLKRMKKGDIIMYYSSKLEMDSPLLYQKIVAIGMIKDDDIYQVEMFPGFFPFRRNVKYRKITHEASLEELKQFDEWKEYSPNLRYGHLKISEKLFFQIYRLMTT